MCRSERKRRDIVRRGRSYFLRGGVVQGCCAIGHWKSETLSESGFHYDACRVPSGSFAGVSIVTVCLGASRPEGSKTRACHPLAPAARYTKARWSDERLPPLTVRAAVLACGVAAPHVAATSQPSVPVRPAGHEMRLGRNTKSHENAAGVETASVCEERLRRARRSRPTFDRMMWLGIMLCFRERLCSRRLFVSR